MSTTTAPNTAERRIQVDFDSIPTVARLRITRADQNNGIDAAFVDDFVLAVDRIVERSAELRAVLIEAEGAHFTVGGDLKHFGGQLHRLSDELVDMIEPFHRTLSTIAELPMPVVCAVQGSIAGGGLGLAWCADIIVAADDLKMVTAFAKLGVSGDGGSSWYLPRLVGQVRALELLLESPILDAQSAKDLGLVTRVVPKEELASEAERTVGHLAAGPTISMGMQRRLARRALDRTMREGYDAELEAMRQCGRTRDAVEGMTAFLEGRAPRFERR